MSSRPERPARQSWFAPSPRRKVRPPRARLGVESLERRELLSTALHLDFGSATSPVAAGYTRVPLAAYSASAGFGWQSTTGLAAVDRGTADPLTRDFHRGRDATFLVDLPNGDYDVTVTLGDATAARDQVSLWLEGQQVATGLNTAAGQFLQQTYRTHVADGQLTLRLADLGGVNTNFAVNGLDVVEVATPAPGPQTFPNNVNVPPLPAPTGRVVNVATVVQLQAAVNGLQSGDTIRIAAGTYTLPDTLYLPQGLSNVTVRGATGNRDDVVIRGAGMAGAVRFGFWVGATTDVTFADFTLRDLREHGVILNAGAERPLFHNLHLVDIGNQFIKSNPDSAGGGVDGGVVEYCVLEYTTTAPGTYTNGVDVHTGDGWVIKNNVFRNFRAAGGLAGPAVLMWNGSRNTVTEGNTFINNQRDIAYGLDAARTNDHRGGVIRNNFISRSGVSGGDVAIGVFNSANTQVLHNTVKLNGGYPNAVEYRFAATTGVQVKNNLTDAAIVSRDGATATLAGNVTNAQNAWFVNPGIGDLHLTAAATAAIDRGVAAGVSTDYDGQARPQGAAPDVGADEFTTGTPAPDTTPPQVAVTNPAGGATVSGTVNLTADATDDVGVVGVQFLLDGQSLGAEDTASPFALSWNTAGLANGTYALAARARDAAGNVATSATVSVTVANNVTGNGLVAAYGFGEGSGTSVADASGNGHAGTVVNATWAAGGRFGGALSFNGVDSRVIVPDSPLLDLTTGMTLEAWVRPTALDGGWRNVILKELPGGLAYSLYANDNAGNPPSAYVETAAGSTWTTGTSVIPLNAWTHLATTYDGTTLRLYVNGTEVASTPLSGALLTSDGVLSIGGNAIWGEFFSGLIDDVRVYDRALTAAQIQADMNTAVDGAAPADTQAPTVALTAPAAGATVSGTVTVSANASDDVGVVGVQFLLNGQPLGAEDTTAPYSRSWDTTGVANGTYTLSARARDAAGNVGTAADVTVTVNNSTPSPAGLVAAYNFNEGSGGSVADASGNGHSGTVVNATWVTGGRFGGALSFNGTNSRVVVADSNLLDLTTGMTLEAWVRPTAINGWETVLLKERPGGLAYALYAADDAGRPPAGYVNTGGGDLSAVGGAVLTLNTWTHLAATYDGSTLRLYVNGTQVSSRAVSGSVLATSGALSIGGNSVWGEYFAGLIDEVRVYNRALSAAEIQADMNTGVSATPDTTAPTVTAVSPAAGAAGVSVGSPVTVTFSEAMDPATVNTNTVQLRNAAGVLVPAAVTYNAITRTATLTPSAALAASSTYTLVVPGGSTTPCVADLAGNHLANDYTCNFTTADPAAAPVASAGPNRSGNEGSPIAFAGSVSGGVAPLTYAWDFGDNATATGTLTPSHAYADNGTYTATLTVTDALGQSSQSSTQVTVANVAPTASPGGPYAGAPGAAIAFTATATDPSPVDTAAGFSYSWNFGDGGTSTQRTPSHAYAAAGTYTVTLTVTDKDGGATTVTTTATVSAAPAPGQYIVTPYDRIPNFGANPTITAVANGPWSSASTWSLGRLPGAGDVVGITNVTVTYDVVSDAAITTVSVGAGGQLTFRTDVNTRLTVQNLLVLQGGTLTVGTEADPVAANVTAEVVIADVALNTAFDPAQYGNGLVALGTVRMHGAVKDDTFIRLAAEPRAGQTTLSLATPAVGWRAGDRLVLPDSRQLDWNQRGSSYAGQWEVLTVAGVSADGRTITLTAPLQFNHPGGRNAAGQLEFLPHVANLTRNVVVKSQSATGTRGHVLFTYRADVDVRYVQFAALGRTRIGALDNTTFSSSGAVTHVGTNQEDRNPVQFRHLIGPTSPQADGYQYTFVGNSVTCPLNPMPFVWGINVNDSHYGLIKDNVLYNWAGAGFVTKTGSESFNVIEHNLVVRTTGGGQREDDFATAGSSFWFRGPNNYVRDNVATTINGGAGDVYSYGFDVYSRFLGSVRTPTAQGADPSAAGQFRTVDMNATPLVEFARNEVYGATPNGMTVWWLGTFGVTPRGDGGVIRDFRVWNFYQWGYFGYETNNLTIDGFVARGDTNRRTENFATAGMWFSDYQQKGLRITNANIQGTATGIDTPYRADGTTVIENSYLRNVVNINVTTMHSVDGSAGLPAKRTVIRNVRFDPLAGLPLRAVSMNYTTVGVGGTPTNLIQRDDVFVYDYNGVAGDNFQVFYTEQRASFIVPQSTGGDRPLIGAPVAGLTNQQAWDQFGIAIAGAVAPATATTRAGIDGLVQPF